MHWPSIFGTEGNDYGSRYSDKTFFWMGVNYVEVLCFLLLYHGMCLSIRQLKRILCS